MSDSTKHARYINNVEIRLSDRRQKLASVKSRVDIALAHRRIGGSEQLRRSITRAERHLEEVEKRFAVIKHANGEGDEVVTRAFDRSWDELAHSIRSVVSRF